MLMRRIRTLRSRKSKTAAIALTATIAGAGHAVAAPRTLPDTQVSRAIDTEMAIDTRTPAHNVDVRTSNGIVTLTGTVNTLLAKERAERIAEATKGVRSVVNLITVKSEEIPDSAVQSDLREALSEDPATTDLDVKVRVKDGVATLTGEVDSFQRRTLAARVVMGVAGVRDVKNEIKFRHADERDDEDVQTDVRHRLESDVMVDAGLIDVTVADGVVSLDGVVGSASEKARAENDAWVTGVKEVSSEDLQVQWWARDEMRRRHFLVLEDSIVEQSILDALAYDPRVSAFNVAVEFTGGAATLSGEVTNLKARRAAEDAARNTVGVFRVDNFIKVRPNDIPADKVLEKRVADALTRDSYVEREQVSIAVTNGEVNLYGTVEDALASYMAEDAASRVRGVQAVDNHLLLATETIRVKSDWEIAQSIRDQFFWSPFVDGDDITVAVEDGVAVLTGTVQSMRERRDAAENAIEGGAIKVRNRLRVVEGPEGLLPTG